MKIRIAVDSDTVSWHLAWTIIDLVIALLLMWGWFHHNLIGQWTILHGFIIGFMFYRTIYHANCAWKQLK